MRVVNALLGAWLVVSVFLWPHAGSEGYNALITGLLVAMVALVAIWAPPVRFANVLLGAWLLVTTLFFRHESELTLWNEVLVATVILVFAFVPSEPWRFRAARAQA